VNRAAPCLPRTERIVQAVKAIPAGKVSSYRDLAWAAGVPKGARQVVWTLHSVSRSRQIPWHRVIRADGYIALRGADRELQIALLRGEGVEVSDSGRVDLARYALPVPAAPADGLKRGRKT
jgi:methylated-DNA-protein-cysteine methyltransferase-like protein